MSIAIYFTLGSFASFLAVVYAASIIAKRHHYYEDPDEDKQHQHHDPDGRIVASWETRVH